MTTTLQTKIADQIASALLHTAEGNLAQAKADADERAGKPATTIDQLDATREQQSGIPGETIGSTVDRIEDETRSIRRSLRRK